MTDITVETTHYHAPNRSWLLFEAGGRGGEPVPRSQAVLDFTTFDPATHYPDGYIPSGTAVGVLTGGGRVGAYSASATDGRETFAGHLFDDVQVPAVRTQKKVVAVVDSFAVVSTGRLPEHSGLDTAARDDAPLIKYRP